MAVAGRHQETIVTFGIKAVSASVHDRASDEPLGMVFGELLGGVSGW